MHYCMMTISYNLIISDQLMTENAHSKNKAFANKMAND